MRRHVFARHALATVEISARHRLLRAGVGVVRRAGRVAHKDSVALSALHRHVHADILKMLLELAVRARLAAKVADDGELVDHVGDEHGRVDLAQRFSAQRTLPAFHDAVFTERVPAHAARGVAQNRETDTALDDVSENIFHLGSDLNFHFVKRNNCETPAG